MNQQDASTDEGITVDVTWPVCMVTGHRPQHFHPDTIPWVRAKLAAGVRWLAERHGTTVAVSGMALGTDHWWAQAALDAGLQLHAYVPFEAQPARWPLSHRHIWQQLLDRAARVVVVGDNPTDRRDAARLLHARDAAMLDASSAVVAVLRGSKSDGGTASAVRLARQRGLAVVHIDPDVQTVRMLAAGPG